MGWFVLKVNAGPGEDELSQRAIVLETENVCEILDCERTKVTKSGIILSKATAKNAPNPNSDATTWPHGDFMTRIRTKTGGQYYTMTHIEDVVSAWWGGEKNTKEDVFALLGTVKKIPKSELN